MYPLEIAPMAPQTRTINIILISKKYTAINTTIVIKLKINSFLLTTSLARENVTSKMIAAMAACIPFIRAFTVTLSLKE